MVKINFIAADGTETIVEAREGDSLMQTAITNGVDGIVGECGGSAMCATCHVYVDSAFAGELPPRSSVEDEMLDCTVSERRENSRLSCQIKACGKIDGIVIHLPETQT